MKKITLIILFGFTLIFGQVTGTIESQKYKLGDGYSYYQGVSKISDSEVAIGSFVTDLDGNIKYSIPSYLLQDFGFSKHGVFVKYQTKIIVMDAYGFATFENMNTISAVGKTQKINFDNNASTSYCSNETCYEINERETFISSCKQLSDYCVFVRKKRVDSYTNGELVKSTETKAKGKRLDHLHTADGMYYALYGDRGSLTLVSINLKNGEDKYLVLNKQKDDYFGGKIQIVDNLIHISCFFGKCESKTNGYNYWADKTTDGLISFVVDPSTFKLNETLSTDVPSEYLDLVTDNKGRSNLYVLDIMSIGDEKFIYTISYNGPAALWHLNNTEISLVHTISLKDSKNFILKGGFVSTKGKNYLLYTEKEEVKQGKFYQRIHLAEFSKNSFDDISISIDGIENVFADFDPAFSFITSGGLILIPGRATDRYDTCYLVKIQM